MSLMPDMVTELYRFIDGSSGAIYTVTSGDRSEVYNAGSGNETYDPVPIGRNETQNKGELSRDNLTISFALDNLVAKGWFVSSLDFPLTVTIFSRIGSVVEIEWKGRLASVSPKKSQIDFVFESVFTSMRRMGLRQRYQINCPHSLYGKGCNLEKNDFDISGSITVVNNAVITMPVADSSPDGYFSSGIFEDNAGNLRFILSHVGPILTLIRPMNALIDFVAANGYVGLTGRLFPGCDRTVGTCNTRFNNLLNYGGFPFMPKKNPFSGSSII